MGGKGFSVNDMTKPVEILVVIVVVYEKTAVFVVVVDCSLWYLFSCLVIVGFLINVVVFVVVVVVF